MNSNGYQKPIDVTCNRMDTTEDLSNNIRQKLPVNAQPVDLTSNGQYLTNGKNLINQNIHNNSRIHSTVRTTGGWLQLNLSFEIEFISWLILHFYTVNLAQPLLLLLCVDNCCYVVANKCILSVYDIMIFMN